MVLHTNYLSDFMKNFLILWMCFISVVSASQTIGLYEVEKEISSIVLNRLSCDSKKFKLKIDHSFGDQKAHRNKLLYKVLDDSTFQVKESKQIRNFRVRDSIFVPIEEKTEIIDQEDLDFFSKSNYLRRCILFYHTRSFYSGDTVLYLQDEFDAELLNPSDFLVEGVDTSSVALQVITKTENNKTVLVRNLFKDAQWRPWCNLTITVTQNGKTGWETVTRGTVYDVDYRKSLAESEVNDVQKTLIEYDENGLIKSITVKRLDRLFGVSETTILTIK